MASIPEAVDSIKVLAARLEGIVQVAQVLERIGSLEQAEREAGDRLATARADATKAQARLAEIQQSVKDAEAQAPVILADARTRADAVIYNAEGRADVITLKAEDAAKQIKANAQAVAQRLTDDAAAVVRAAQDSKADIDAQRKLVTEQVEQAQKELAELTEKIYGHRYPQP